MEIEDGTQSTLKAGQPNQDALAAVIAANSPKPAEGAPAEPVAPAAKTVEPAVKAEAGDTAHEKGERQYSLDDLTVETGLTSPEEIKAAIKQLKELEGKLGGKDLEQVLEAAKTLEGYEKAWKIEDELAKEANETQEETIARLKEEKRIAYEAEQNRTVAEREEAESREMLQKYDVEVGKVLSTAKDLDPLAKEFLSNMLASTNDSNTFDPSDPVAVRTMAKNRIDAIAAFQRSTIQNYLDGKVAIPDITPTSGAPAPGKGPQSLKESIALAAQMAKEGRIRLR